MNFNIHHNSAKKPLALISLKRCAISGGHFEPQIMLFFTPNMCSIIIYIYMYGLCTYI